jgi:hypothetical protein
MQRMQQQRQEKRNDAFCSRMLHTQCSSAAQQCSSWPMCGSCVQQQSLLITPCHAGHDGGSPGAHYLSSIATRSCALCAIAVAAYKMILGHAWLQLIANLLSHLLYYYRARKVSIIDCDSQSI